MHERKRHAPRYGDKHMATVDDEICDKLAQSLFFTVDDEAEIYFMRVYNTPYT